MASEGVAKTDKEIRQGEALLCTPQATCCVAAGLTSRHQDMGSAHVNFMAREAICQVRRREEAFR